MSSSRFFTLRFMTQVAIVYRRSHYAQASNMLTRPVGPLREVRIADDLSPVHVVQLINQSTIITTYCIATPTADFFASIVCLADAPPPLIAGAAPSAAQLDGCERILGKQDHRAQAR